MASLKNMSMFQLGESGDLRAIPFLIDGIKSRERGVRRLAASAIRKLYVRHGIYDPAVVPVLLTCILEDSKQVRHYALSALAKLPVDRQVANSVQEIAKKVKDNDPCAYNQKAAAELYSHYDLVDHKLAARQLIDRYDIRTLYHFTDCANIASILEERGLLSAQRLEEKGIVVPRPGGNQWSRDADRQKGLHCYVHLSFLPEHPMRYVAEQERRIGPVKILEIDSSVLLDPGVLFTGDISNKSGVQTCGLEETYNAIDYEVIYSNLNWREPDVLERRTKAKRAEVLIPSHIPLELIRNL